MSQGGIDPEKVTKPIQLVAAWLRLSSSSSGSSSALQDRFRSRRGFPSFTRSRRYARSRCLRAWCSGCRRVIERSYKKTPTTRSSARNGSSRRASRRRTFPVRAATSLAGRSSILVISGQRWMRIVEKQRGLFVVHTWRPSTQSGQVADITIRLHEHGPEWTPISNGDVERVEYYLGSSFFGGKAVSKTNANDGFRLDVSAWGSTVCVARVHFRNEDPVEIYRYLDFAVAS